MLVDALPHLECPNCRAGLSLDGSAVRCARGHVFDVARQGYVNLLSGKASVAGDSAEMVAARTEFLAAGHYAPITRSVVAASRSAPAGCVLDLGAGTGHYLAAVLAQAPARVGIALEVAKPALRRAARAHQRIGAVGADTWRRLPVRDGSVALALNVFAPRNAAEIHRVLRPAGALVVVSPTEVHLAELVSELDLLTVAPDKAARIAESLAPRLRMSTQDKCEFGMSLGHEDVLRLIGMGPSAWHVDRASLRERLAVQPNPFPVTASVQVTIFERGSDE